MKNFLIDTPAPLIDLDKLEKNIRDMAQFCRSRNIALRPHIKTHKIAEIAQLQLKEGACGITVAKLGEAEAMAGAGITDIFIANQITGQAKLTRLAALAKRVKLSVGVDSWVNAWELNNMAKAQGLELSVLLEIDTGLHRCGLAPGEEVISLAGEIQSMPNLNFLGIFTHAGHAYAAQNLDEVRKIGRHEGESMAALASELRKKGIPVSVVSVGSTPTALFAGEVPGVTELRPGNYVFFDAIQTALGVIEPERCALRVRATVISCPETGRAVIDAGSKALNLDKGAHGLGLVKGYGLVVGRPGITVERLSEEHGVLSLGEGEELRVGDQIEIIPNHACTVINLYNKVTAVRKGKPEKELTVIARGQVT